MSQSQALPSLNRVQTIALIVGLVGLVLLAAGWFLSPASFFQAYLVGYMLWVQVALGCLAILMIYNMTGGGGVCDPTYPQAGMLTLPPCNLFVPILLGLPSYTSGRARSRSP
jgi:hypothetical protein